jgi:hypothetical protein
MRATAAGTCFSPHRHRAERLLSAIPFRKRALRSVLNRNSKMSLSGLVNGIELCIAYGFAAQVEMDGGCDDQR